MSNDYIYEISKIEKLVPLEKVFQFHLINLEKMIKKDGCIDKPIIADQQTGTVLDGSHRYAFLLKNGFLEAPVIWVNYSSEKISTGISLSKEEIINRKGLLEPRTTRHKFPFQKINIKTSLEKLKIGEEKNIDFLISNSSEEEEIQHHLKFIEELEETKKYLLKQINFLKKKAYFPGKFNPPHFGHFLSIMDLSKIYDLTVVVTGEKIIPEIYTQDEIVNEIKKLGIPVIKIDQKLTELRKIPEFITSEEEIIISGNEEVEEWCKNLGIQFKNYSRSGIIESTKIRKYYDKRVD